MISAPLEVELRGRAAWARPEPASIIKNARDALVWRQRASDGLPAVWKLYSHRPWRAWERSGRVACRAQREFEALAFLQVSGVPCSAPLAWARGESVDLARYELLVTREVPGALDLSRWLAGSDEAARCALDLAPLFAAVRAMHAGGLQHGALAIRNVLISPTGFHLIDLPRRQWFGRSIVGSAAARFDLGLLVQELVVHLPPEHVAAALAATHPEFSAASALRWTRALHDRPMSGLALNAANARGALQAAWLRRVGAASAPRLPSLA
jgi:tRNA A-37 threonylcarbamoyl transferase component Bud32